MSIINGEHTLMENVGLRKFIGRGRSARVFLWEDEGRQIATKTFTGEKVSKMVLFVLTGSANPYTWCEDAIICALARRKLLTHLCEYWFGDDLSLPATWRHRWNEDLRAFEIDAQYIDGQHAPLYSPLRSSQVDFVRELKFSIMKPLQSRLMEAGFDGLVWQAGKGNPVGASNFMLQRNGDKHHRWIWIDLESGLPALFALNPLSTLFYYIPMCFKHRGWLFDDVDCLKVERYIESCQSELGENAYQTLVRECEVLKKHQRRWKSLSRHQRSLGYAVSQEKISRQQYDYYLARPFRWMIAIVIRGVVSVSSSLVDGIGSLIKRIRRFRYRKMFKRIIRYCSNSYYRWGVIRWFIKREINDWHNRGFLFDSEKRVLERELHKDEISAYLTDFSIHIGVKPFIKVFLWGVLPVMIATQSISLTGAAIVILWTGSLVRTIYTLWRISHSLLKSRPHYPFVALMVGIFPMVGNLAYPLEILYQSAGKGNLLGKFMTCAFGAKIGSKIPIWGGKDTEIEHFFNRIGHRITCVRFGLKKSSQ